MALTGPAPAPIQPRVVSTEATDDPEQGESDSSRLSNEEESSPKVTNAQVTAIAALRAARANAKRNVKKTRMAFNTAQAAADTGSLRTVKFDKTKLKEG